MKSLFDAEEVTYDLGKIYKGLLDWQKIALTKGKLANPKMRGIHANFKKRGYLTANENYVLSKWVYDHIADKVIIDQVTLFIHSNKGSN